MRWIKSLNKLNWAVLKDGHCINRIPTSHHKSMSSSISDLVFTIVRTTQKTIFFRLPWPSDESSCAECRRLKEDISAWVPVLAIPFGICIPVIHCAHLYVLFLLCKYESVLTFACMRMFSWDDINCVHAASRREHAPLRRMAYYWFEFVCEDVSLCFFPFCFFFGPHKKGLLAREAVSANVASFGRVDAKCAALRWTNGCACVCVRLRAGAQCGFLRSEHCLLQTTASSCTLSDTPNSIGALCLRGISGATTDARIHIVMPHWLRIHGLFNVHSDIVRVGLLHF